jgi:hypothetical protein
MLAGGATSALAQVAAPAPGAAQQPDAASAAISDADIQAYASVAVKLNEISGNAALSEADKNAQMAAAVQSSGLDVAKFNAITESSKSDPALQKKIQDAMPAKP